jgi:hypothetical protein
MRLDLVLNVIENSFRDRFIVIFTNCQVAIRVIQCFKKQSDQYLLQTLTRRIEFCDREIHIHWILAHVEVFDNEAIDIAVKKIIEWKQSNRNSLTFVIVNSKIFISAIKNEIRIRERLSELRHEKSSSLKKSFIESSKSSSRMLSKNSKKWRDQRARSSFKLEQIKSNWEIIFIR